MEKIRTIVKEIQKEVESIKNFPQGVNLEEIYIELKPEIYQLLKKDVIVTGVTVLKESNLENNMPLFTVEPEFFSETDRLFGIKVRVNKNLKKDFFVSKPKKKDFGFREALIISAKYELKKFKEENEKTFKDLERAFDSDALSDEMLLKLTLLLKSINKLNEENGMFKETMEMLSKTKGSA